MSAKKALKKQAGRKFGKNSAPFPIEALIEDFVEKSADGILISEKKTRKIKYANSTICKMLGYTNAELMNMLVDDIHPKKHQKKAVSEFLAMPEETGKLAKDIACMTKDSKVIYTDVHGTAKTIGKTTYVFGLFRDESDRKHLTEREEELKIKTKNLEELNNALKVLLERRDEDRVEMEEKVVLNVRRLILPYFDKLKESGINQRQQAFVQILEESLSDIISPFSRTLSTKFVNFTGSEIKIASLIRQGKKTKDIAKLLGISKRTVEAHRDHIRTKLGLKTIKGNLRTHLLSI